MLNKNSRKLGPLSAAYVILMWDCCSSGKTPCNTIGFVPQEVSARRRKDSQTELWSESVGFLRLQIVHDGYKRPSADPSSQHSWANFFLFFFFFARSLFLWVKSSQCVNNKWKLDREIGPELRSVFFIFFTNGLVWVSNHAHLITLAEFLLSLGDWFLILDRSLY